MTAVLKKPVLVNPIQQAFEDYAILQNENEILKHSEIQLKDMNVGLLQENKILNERLRDVEADRDALKTYAYELVARLDVIVETIHSAKAKSRNLALRKEPEKEPAYEVNEDEIESQVRELVSDKSVNKPKIPPNSYQ